MHNYGKEPSGTPALRAHSSFHSIRFPLYHAVTRIEPHCLECTKLGEPVHELDFEVGSGFLQISKKNRPRPRWSSKRVQNESYCQCNSEREVWSFLRFNPIEKILEPALQSWRAPLVALPKIDLRQVRDQRSASSFLVDFLSNVVCFSTISDQQTIENHAKPMETPRETHRRALVAIEPLWSPNQTR